MKTCQYRPFLWRCKFCFYFCFLILVLVMWRHYLKIKMRMLIIYYQLWHSLMILRGAGNCLQRKSVDPSVEKSISKSCYSLDSSINRNWFAATFFKDTGRNRAWNFSLRQIRITTSVKTSPLICRSNKWAGFYVIGTSIKKGLLKTHYVIYNCSRKTEVFRTWTFPLRKVWPINILSKCNVRKTCDALNVIWRFCVCSV